MYVLYVKKNTSVLISVLFFALLFRIVGYSRSFPILYAFQDHLINFCQLKKRPTEIRIGIVSNLQLHLEENCPLNTTECSNSCMWNVFLIIQKLIFLGNVCNFQFISLPLLLLNLFLWIIYILNLSQVFGVYHDQRWI